LQVLDAPEHRALIAGQPGLATQRANGSPTSLLARADGSLHAAERAAWRHRHVDFAA
jgi:hypothetical protein